MKSIGLDLSTMHHFYVIGILKALVESLPKRFVIHFYGVNAIEILNGLLDDRREKYLNMSDLLLVNNMQIVCGETDKWFDQKIGRISESEYDSNNDELNNYFKNIIKQRRKLDTNHISCIKELYRPQLQTVLSLLRYRKDNWRIARSISIIKKDKDLWEGQKIPEYKNSNEMTTDEIREEIDLLKGRNPENICNSIDYLRQVHFDSKYHIYLKNLINIHIQEQHKIPLSGSDITPTLVSYAYLFELIIDNVIFKGSPNDDFSEGALFDSDVLYSALISNTNVLIVSDKALYRVSKYVLKKVYKQKNLEVIFYDPQLNKIFKV